MKPLRYSELEIAAVYRAIAERRDMRHFKPGPIDPAVLQRLLEAAHHAPSVGLMQPWRFIRITDITLRKQIHALVEAERQHTATALGEREAEFLRLKVEGVRAYAGTGRLGQGTAIAGIGHAQSVEIP
jgi:5,6-dimethylbenzimidazole synthase